MTQQIGLCCPLALARAYTKEKKLTRPFAAITIGGKTLLATCSNRSKTERRKTDCPVLRVTNGRSLFVLIKVASFCILALDM